MDTTRQAHQDAHQDTPPGAPGEWVTIAEAARSLGVSADAIRRRIKRHTMRAKRGTATHGGPPPYLVWLGTDDNVIPFPEEAPGRRQDVHQVHQDSRQAHQDAAMTLATARAAEMAAYSQQLLAPYVQRIEEQAEEIGTLKERCATLHAQLVERPEAIPPVPAPDPGQAERIGRLEAELEHAREQLAEATSTNDQVETQNDAAPAWPERRSWWWRLVWG